MTLDLIRDEIWRHIGEPSDLDPDSDTSYAGGPLLTWVANEGQRSVSAWQDSQTGRIFRVRSLMGEMFYQTTYITGTLEGDGTTTTIVFPAGDVNSNDDRYNGWVVGVGAESRLIVDYDGASYTATVAPDWSTAPATDDTYYLYKQFELLLPSTHTWVDDHISLPVETDRSRATGNLIEILRLYDVEETVALEKAQKEEDFITNWTSSGDPSGWIRIGNKLWYDFPVKEEKWLKLEYQRLPTDMSEDTDQPEVPEHLHWGIVLWGIMWGYSRHQEPSMKWSAKQDFNDFMKKSVSQYQYEFERSDDHGILQQG